MLRDRYKPYSLFEAVPQLALRFEPELAVVDRLLDDDALFGLVRDDLARRYPRTPLTGRPSTPVEVVLRLLVVKHLYGWSYEDTERFVADSLVQRQSGWTRRTSSQWSLSRAHARRAGQDRKLVAQQEVLRH